MLYMYMYMYVYHLSTMWYSTPPLKIDAGARKKSRRHLDAVGARASAMANAAFTMTLEPRAPPSGTHQPSSGAVSPLVIEKGRQTAWLHVPQSPAAPGPLPLLVVLHGAGKDTMWTLKEGSMSVDAWAERANKYGIAVLYPASRGSTWDYISSRGQTRADFDFLQHAINTVRRTISIDDRRIGLVGLSDGGSMALSLACHNQGVFQAAMSISAGFCANPPRAGLQAPKMFVKHGASDDMFPLKRVGLALRDQLASRGYKVEHRIGQGAGGMFGPAGHVPPGWHEEFLPAWLAMEISR